MRKEKEFMVVIRGLCKGMRKDFNQRSFCAEETIRVILRRWEHEHVSGDGEEFYRPGAKRRSGEVGSMILRGLEYQCI